MSLQRADQVQRKAVMPSDRFGCVVVSVLIWVGCDAIYITTLAESDGLPHTRYHYSVPTSKQPQSLEGTGCKLTNHIQYGSVGYMDPDPI